MIGEVTKLYKLQNNLVTFFIVPCKHSDQTQTYNRDIFMSWLELWPRLHLAAGLPVIGVGTTTSTRLLSSWLLINAAILLRVTSAMVVVWGHKSVFVDSASWRSRFHPPPSPSLWQPADWCVIELPLYVTVHHSWRVSVSLVKPTPLHQGPREQGHQTSGALRPWQDGV